MEQPTAEQSTERQLPEKPSAVQFNMPQHQHQQQQQHFQPVELPKVEPFKPSKPFSVGKVTLASFNFVFAIITLGLSLGLITLAWSFDSFIGVIIAASAVSSSHSCQRALELCTDIPPPPHQAAASIIWQLAEYITILVRRSIYRPIHPGAHVGVHLVLDVLCILVVGSLSTSLAYGLADWIVDSRCDGTNFDYYDGNHYVYCDYDTFSSRAQANKYFALLEALVAFSTLMTISHFVLFVLACVETDRRRKYGKQTKVVYLVAGPGPVDGRSYYSQVLPGQSAGGPLAPQPIHPAANAEAYGYYAPGPSTSQA